MQYRTTSYFLERIGITSLDDLPELAPYLPEMDDLADELEQVAASGGPVVTAPADDQSLDDTTDGEPR